MNADKRGRPVCRGFIRVHPWSVKAVFSGKNPGKFLAGYLSLRRFDLTDKLNFFKHQTSNIKHQASNIEHQTSNIKHQASNIKHQTSNIKHQTSNIKHQTSNIKHQT